MIHDFKCFVFGAIVIAKNIAAQGVGIAQVK